MPSTSKIFAMLLPAIFPTTRSVSAFIDANIFTISSGSDVPSATTVSPIVISGTLYFFDIALAPFISESAPFISSTKPNTNIMYVITSLY